MSQINKISIIIENSNFLGVYILRIWTQLSVVRTTIRIKLYYHQLREITNIHSVHLSIGS